MMTVSIFSFTAISSLSARPGEIYDVFLTAAITPNPKSEYRNPKQTRSINSELEKSETRIRIRIDFVSDLELRISCFGLASASSAPSAVSYPNRSCSVRSLFDHQVWCQHAQTESNGHANTVWPTASK